MPTNWDQGGGLLHGPLLDRAGSLPFTIRVVLCDLSARFLAKGRAGRGYRAVARNGRVLLASPMPLSELAHREVRVRFQVWHTAVLPGDAPEPHGILLGARAPLARRTTPDAENVYRAQLVRNVAELFVLELEVGGGMSLAFSKPEGLNLSHRR
jgi:hypothetical protein